VLAALGAAGLAVALGVAWQSPAWRSARDRAARQALLDALQPVALANCTLTRIGGEHDPGYVMCKNLLEGLESVYSYGVDGRDDWGCDISSRYRVPVHQYCPTAAQPTCRDGYFDFHTECVADRRTLVDARWHDTLDAHIAGNGDRGRKMVVRMDIDGAEWDVLMATPDEVLAGIDQLPMDFYGVGERRFLEVIRKMKRTFHIANLYFNNHACSPDAAPLPASAYQVLFVNKRIGVVDASEPGTPLPSPQNMPDDPQMPDCQLDVPDRAARERRVRQELLDELRPVALQNCTLARVGSANDGGYLMCGNLIEHLGAAYSYGVGPNDDWGCQISSTHRVPVHQYDCFDPARPACPTGTFVFHDECIAERREKAFGRLFDTLTSQIARNGDTGKRLIVKIDVEGAEWDALMATPDEVLATIDQLPMELHGVNEAKFVEVVRKLKRNFYLVNLHFNNFSCSPEAAPLPAVAYQVLFVNKRIGVLDASKGTPPPSPLNAPDRVAPAPDCQLQ
jgi:hypothetical protein